MTSVLIVEDYQSIQDIYAHAFRQAGFEVETARSGAEGLKKVGQREYEVIVLDMLMLELSGNDFLEGFEATKHPDTKVVVTSNLDSPKVIEKAKSLGAADYLIKSQYTPKQLVDHVQALLSVDMSSPKQQ
jgi:DNA-binding NtrC family response regulator